MKARKTDAINPAKVPTKLTAPSVPRGTTVMVVTKYLLTNSKQITSITVLIVNDSLLINRQHIRTFEIVTSKHLQRACEQTNVVLPKALPISLPIVSLSLVQKLARKPNRQRGTHAGPKTPQIVAIAHNVPAVPDPHTLPGPLLPPLFSAVPSAFFSL